MLCVVDDDIELRPIESHHFDGLRGMDPGELFFAQGEWIFPQGKGAEWLANALIDVARETSILAGIFIGTTLVGLVGLHEVDQGRGSATLTLRWTVGIETEE